MKTRKGLNTNLSYNCKGRVPLYGQMGIDTLGLHECGLNIYATDVIMFLYHRSSSNPSSSERNLRFLAVFM